MTSEFFDSLLYEDESTTLDFKDQQYPFAKATDEAKSELLKDILGMVNAWRRAEAYILIGVRHVRGGPSQILGVTEHLDDHSLQQFVNNATNRPVLFGYRASSFHGKPVGVIRVDLQPRPVYLKRDYGKLLKHAVYVRRGSSTDPTKPALPEEIALMGQAPLRDEAPELHVEWALSEADEGLGSALSLQTELCHMPLPENIPDYAPRKAWRNALSSIPGPNPEYFRALARFVSVHRLFRPVRLVVHNASTVMASAVTLELSAEQDPDIQVAYEHLLPDAPEREGGPFMVQRAFSPGSTIATYPGKVLIEGGGPLWKLEIDCGTIQPGRRVWSDVFYLGRNTTGSINFTGKVFATNLPTPKEVTLSASFAVAPTTMTVEELLAL